MSKTASLFLWRAEGAEIARHLLGAIRLMTDYKPVRTGQDRSDECCNNKKVPKSWGFRTEHQSLTSC